MTTQRPHALRMDGGSEYPQAILDSLSAQIVILDCDGRIEAVNAAWRRAAEINGLDPNTSMVGASYLTVCDAVTGAEAEAARAVASGIRRILAGYEREFVYEYPLYSGSEPRWFIARVTRFAGDGPARVVVAHEDITARVVAEQALRQTERENRTLVEHSPDIIIRYDRAYRHVYVNAAIERATGLQPAALTGKRHRDIGSPARYIDMWEHNLQQVFDSGSIRTIQFDNLTPDGMRWFEARLLPEFAPDGTVESILCIGRDITESHQARIELETSARQLRELAQASLALNATFTLDEVAAILTEQARTLIGAHWAVTSLTANQDWAQVITHASFSEHYANWPGPHGLPDGSDIYRLVSEQNTPMRLTQAELESHPAWREFGTAATHMPLRGWLAAPLISRDGANLGLIQLSDKVDGEFSDTDESLLVQLAQLASVAIDNARLYHNAETARREYQMLVEQVPAVTYREIADPASNNAARLYFSPQIEALLGYPVEEWTNRGRWMSLIHPDDLERVLEADREADRTGQPFSVDYRLIARDGREVIVHDEARLVRDADGRPVSWQGMFVDITAMRAAEDALRQSEARFRSAFDDASVAMALMDLNGHYTRVNAALCRMLGYQESELLMRHSVDITHPDDRHMHLPYTRRLAAGEIDSFQIEKRYLHRDGRTIWAILNLSRVRGGVEGQQHYLGQMQDITERKRLEAQLRHDALHDTLTGLPNRALLLDRLEQSLVRTRRRRRATAVLFLDLDNFKVVNDSLGHVEGDRLLVEVASRIAGCVRGEDTVSRFGGDEFAILLPDIDGVATAVEVAERIATAFSAPFNLAGREILITTSTGIVLSRGIRDTPDDLLRHADVAMYRAKHLGKNRYDLFDADMHADSLRRLQMETDLREAIECDRLRLVYQPKISLATGETVGCEALVRWQDPERGLIAPAEFIPLAEETGLIVPLGAWVVREACRQAAAWNVAANSFDTPAAPFMISVNLSARQFQQPDLIDVIAGILAETNLPAGQLMIELTETVVMDDAESSVQRLQRLKQLGVLIAIDDFGTGYSSLAYLRRFPVDVLKIDRGFVDGLGREPEASPIVAATIGLAHALGILVVAEGVETEAQLQHLRDLDCDLAQGYYFAHPLQPDQMTEYLSARGTRQGALTTQPGNHPPRSSVYQSTTVE